MDFFNVLSCIGGIALFLFGMTYMGDALKKCAGNQMKNFLTRMTSSPTKAFTIGLLATMVIQSSTATNVMAVSFVNTSMMTLSQATPLMIGSNLGTTITAWLLSLSSIGGASFFIQLLKPASFTAILAFIGIILYRFQNNERKKDVGAILIGFSILMFGMTTMSGSMSGLSSVPGFMKLFDVLTNPLLGFLVGLLMAGIMQSSSASVGVLQALALSGSISMESVVPIVIGINLGQVLPVVISSTGTSKNARRTALVDVFINLSGAIIFLPLYTILRGCGVLGFLAMIATPISIAIFHTSYKAVLACILLPAHKLLENLARKAIKEEKEGTVKSLLDPRLMATPSLALAQTRQRITEVVNVTKGAFENAVSLMDSWSDDVAENVHNVEDMVDVYKDEIEEYLAQLSIKSLTETESKELSKLLHVISHYESITDHIYHMVVSYKELWDNDKSFSEKAKSEIYTLRDSMSKVLDLANACFHYEDPEASFQVVNLEHEIVHACAAYRENHLTRLKQGICSVREGCVFSDLLFDYERIADHLSKEARLTLVEVYKSTKSFESSRLLSALLDQNPDLEERIKRSLK